MNENYSLADIKSVIGDNGFFGGGSGGWGFLIILFLLFGGNGWGYGNNNAMTNVERDVLTTSAATQSAVKDASYNALLTAKDAQAQMSSCCCDIKTAIHNDGEATRALITQNRMAELEYQLNQANNAIANAVQTQNILNSLGRYVTNPSVPNYGYYFGNTNV